MAQSSGGGKSGGGTGGSTSGSTGGGSKGGGTSGSTGGSSSGTSGKTTSSQSKSYWTPGVSAQTGKSFSAPSSATTSNGSKGGGGSGQTVAQYVASGGKLPGQAGYTGGSSTQKGNIPGSGTLPTSSTQAAQAQALAQQQANIQQLQALGSYVKRDIPVKQDPQDVLKWNAQQQMAAQYKFVGGASQGTQTGVSPFLGGLGGMQVTPEQMRTQNIQIQENRRGQDFVQNQQAVANRLAMFAGKTTMYGGAVPDKGVTKGYYGTEEDIARTGGQPLGHLEKGQVLRGEDPTQYYLYPGLQQKIPPAKTTAQLAEESAQLSGAIAGGQITTDKSLWLSNLDVTKQTYGYGTHNTTILPEGTEPPKLLVGKQENVLQATEVPKLDWSFSINPITNIKTGIKNIKNLPTILQHKMWQAQSKFDKEATNKAFGFSGTALAYGTAYGASELVAHPVKTTITVAPVIAAEVFGGPGAALAVIGAQEAYQTVKTGQSPITRYGEAIKYEPYSFAGSAIATSVLFGVGSYLTKKAVYNTESLSSLTKTAETGFLKEQVKKLYPEGEISVSLKTKPEEVQLIKKGPVEIINIAEPDFSSMAQANKVVFENKAKLGYIDIKADTPKYFVEQTKLKSSKPKVVPEASQISITDLDKGISTQQILLKTGKGKEYMVKSTTDLTGKSNIEFINLQKNEVLKAIESQSLAYATLSEPYLKIKQKAYISQPEALMEAQMKEFQANYVLTGKPPKGTWIPEGGVLFTTLEDLRAQTLRPARTITRGKPVYDEFGNLVSKGEILDIKEIPTRYKFVKENIRGLPTTLEIGETSSMLTQPSKFGVLEKIGIKVESLPGTKYSKLSGFESLYEYSRRPRYSRKFTKEESLVYDEYLKAFSETKKGDIFIAEEYMPITFRNLDSGILGSMSTLYGNIFISKSVKPTIFDLFKSKSRTSIDAKTGINAIVRHEFFGGHWKDFTKSLETGLNPFRRSTKNINPFQDYRTQVWRSLSEAAYKKGITLSPESMRKLYQYEMASNLGAYSKSSFLTESIARVAEFPKSSRINTKTSQYIDYLTKGKEMKVDLIKNRILIGKYVTPKELLNIKNLKQAISPARNIETNYLKAVNKYKSKTGKSFFEFVHRRGGQLERRGVYSTTEKSMYKADIFQQANDFISSYRFFRKNPLNKYIEFKGEQIGRGNFEASTYINPDQITTQVQKIQRPSVKVGVDLSKYRYYSPLSDIKSSPKFVYSVPYIKTNIQKSSTSLISIPKQTQKQYQGIVTSNIQQQKPMIDIMSVQVSRQEQLQQQRQLQQQMQEQTQTQQQTTLTETGGGFMFEVPPPIIVMPPPFTLPDAPSLGGYYGKRSLYERPHSKKRKGYAPSLLGKYLGEFGIGTKKRFTGEEIFTGGEVRFEYDKLVPKLSRKIFKTKKLFKPIRVNKIKLFRKK